MGSLTSGAINTISVPVSEFILDALQDLRVLGDGASPTQNDLTDATRKFNFLLHELPAGNTLLWTRDTLEIPTQANVTQYTVGPAGSGATITAYRPLRAFTGCFARTTQAGSTFDVTLQLLSRVEWMQTSSKNVPGTVNSLYYDPQMSGQPGGGVNTYDPALSYGIFYFYVTPANAIYTIFVEVQRPLQDIVAPVNVIDLPMEWYGSVSKMLAASIADKYEIPEPRIMRIKKEAEMAHDKLMNWGATEQGVPVTFVLDPTMQMYRDYT